VRTRWHPAALAVFYDLPIHSATLVDRAVIDLATHGRGPLTWVAPYHRLEAGKYEIALAFDQETRTISVIAVYRSAR
jgi:hypothetical protein